MEFESTCPQCQATFRVAAESTVTTVQCQKCTHSFQTTGGTAVDGSDNESEAPLQDAPSDPAKPNPPLFLFKAFCFVVAMLICAAASAAVGWSAGMSIGSRNRTGHMSFAGLQEAMTGFAVCGIAGFFLPLAILIFVRRYR